MRGQLEAQLSEEAEGASILFDLLEKADAELDAHVSKGLERLRARLSHFAAFDEDDLAATLALEAEPLVAMRRDEASELRARLRLAVRRQRVELHEQALHLCSRFEGAGKIFDGHLASITELYASYRQRLHNAREKHELADRELESKLDAELLAMRRAADIDELNGHLRTALALLEEIKGEYVAFLGAAGEINAEQPVRVQAELDALKSTLVEFHELLPREAYDDKLRLLIEGDAAAETEAAAAAAAAAAEGEGEGEGGGEEAEAAKAAREEAEAAAAKAAAEAADLQEEEDLVATFGFVYPAKMEAEIRLEEEYLGLEHKEEVLYADPHALTTGGGARYQMITGACAAELRAREAAAAPAPTEFDDAAAAGGAEPSAATDAPAGGGPRVRLRRSQRTTRRASGARWTAVAAEEVRAKHLLPVDFGDGLCAAPVIASAEAALALRTQLAAVCLTYHEVHAPKVYGRAVAETEALQAESTRELDERLLAHRPRAGQIELDMYQERDFELMAHRERFVRHQKVVAAAAGGARGGARSRARRGGEGGGRPPGEDGGPAPRALESEEQPHADAAEAAARGGSRHARGGAQGDGRAVRRAQAPRRRVARAGAAGEQGLCGHLEAVRGGRHVQRDRGGPLRRAARGARRRRGGGSGGAV